MAKIYLAGSLRNPKIPLIGNRIRSEGFEVFDDWFAGGKIADDEWQAYERLRGRTYLEALQGHAARNTYNFDLRHIEDSDAMVLALPAGKSAHLELGWVRGSGRPGWMLFDQEPERWEVMTQFASGVFMNIDDLCRAIKERFIF